MSVRLRLSVIGAGLLAAGCASTRQDDPIVFMTPYSPTYQASASDSDVCAFKDGLPETAPTQAEWSAAYRARGLTPERCGPQNAARVVEIRSKYKAEEMNAAIARERLAAREREQASGGPSAGSVAGALFTGLVAFAVAKDARRGAFTPTPAPRVNNGLLPIDINWQWDEFYGPNGRLVWGCRGVQTGQFAPEEKCAGSVKTDIHWPEKLIKF